MLSQDVQFRDNAETAIRRNLVHRGVVTGIFMIDASGAIMKDGPKNRLRERDIHRIVDSFRKQRDVFIDQLEKRLAQRTVTETLFTIRWPAV